MQENKKPFEIFLIKKTPFLTLEILLTDKLQIIPFALIRRVYCNDSEDKSGESNKEFTMTIEIWKNKKYWLESVMHLK